MSMLINGGDGDQEPPEPTKTIALSIAQTLSFNCVDRRRGKATDGRVHHPKERETPQAIMLAMKLHLHSGEKGLIDMMSRRGMCISYSRLRQISTDLANSTIAAWETEGVVFPMKAMKGIFTTCGMDNIDYNSTSTTAAPESMLHGTGISVLQHLSVEERAKLNPPRKFLNEDEMGKKMVRPLPQVYTDMTEVQLSSDVTIPSLQDINSHPVIAARSVPFLLDEEFRWLEVVTSKMEHDLTQDDWVSWGAFFASHQEPPKFKTQSSMLPIFSESAHSPTTVLHCMQVIIKTTNHLNTGQTPVMAVDQPLYAIAKRLQWQFPQSSIAEDKFLVMLGAMHVEKVLWTCAGDWLESSGWTTIIINAGITSSGSAQSMLKASHICRTRYIHQAFAACIYALAKGAYESLKITEMSFEEWLQERCSTQPQAAYWWRTLQLELLILEVSTYLLNFHGKS